ncbi:thioesterase [Sphingomonas oleivorans]|uniref:Thioesterase n=1 Tax=Sphingomonas oleivorans TaxID=1735121 RepID=A0A2T5FXJ7_9SPHN|nr:PaaI family thioesterase [Sphingomonas oleivorans]PTQ10860.1 thioesterase [Sphingomonas oleivorans]
MTDSRYGFVPDAENAGWLVRPASDGTGFADIFGDIRLRIEGDRSVRMRLDTHDGQRNLNGTVHGGFLLAAIDQSYFIATIALGISGGLGGVTVDSATQFLRTVSIGPPIELVVELLRETGRMIFLRGLVEQEGEAVAAFSGTLRKARG